MVIRIESSTRKRIDVKMGKLELVTHGFNACV